MADLLGIIACGKYAPSPLHLCFQPPCMEKGEQIHVIKPLISAEKKTAVSRCHGDEIHNRRVVRQIASAFAGDPHFQPDLVHLLKKKDFCPVIGCCDSRQKSRHAAADNGDFFTGGAHKDFLPPQQSNGGTARDSHPA